MHRFFHLSGLGAVATFFSEASGAMVVVQQKYSGAGCASANMKKNEGIKEVNKCEHFGEGKYAKLTCSGTVATYHFYTDDACVTAASPSSWTSTCEDEDFGSEMYTCMDEPHGTYSMWNTDDCTGTDNMTDEGIVRAIACRRKADWENDAWTEQSEKLEVSADGKMLISNMYATMDCTGDVTRNATEMTCGCAPRDGGFMRITYPGCGTRGNPSASMASDHYRPSLLIIVPLIFVTRASSM